MTKMVSSSTESPFSFDSSQGKLKGESCKFSITGFLWYGSKALHTMDLVLVRRQEKSAAIAESGNITLNIGER